ncbi:MAG: diaminopimelate epimerase [Phoenicibacter congonensis]|uniref:Diaminopimelate epimerase n=1 Tax=Phoenicibacter congonensis TaxID=1944646 RepID=A0AA43RI21_9ACTN|nr:diaminopimelate epimerase [Phoenicibacter congonensis]
MQIKFTKMHGCANDYIYINCLDGMPFDPNELAKVMSPRHFSVGADGVVCICASDVADAKMRMFNLDGSEGKMCGNAIRCVGKYLYDNGICQKEEITIETLSGIKTLALHVEDGAVASVTVQMGQATFEPKLIPIDDTEPAILKEIEVAGKTWKTTAVSMGNPHSVIVTEGIDALDLEKIGPEFENLPYFPERVNTEFIEVVDRRHIKMRVWERGSGETYACGTGACGSVAACVKNGFLDANEQVAVDLIGGTLYIKCCDNFDIEMTGPAKKVYEGIFEYEN